jgi:hypothetical protein
MTQQGLGDVTAGPGHQLDGSELDRLVVVHPAGQTVANANLNRCGDGPDRERDDEAQAVVAIAPTAQHPGGVDRSDQESAHQKLVYDFLSLADRPGRGITRPG